MKQKKQVLAQGAMPEALRNFDSLPDSANVRVNVVASIYGCSPATVWRMAKQGNLPKPRKLSERVTCWNVAELRAALTEAGVFK